MTDPATLPEYKGRKPVGMKTSMNGASNRITRPHDIGDRVILITEAECTTVGHRKIDGKLTYVEAYSITDMFEILDPKAASKLMVAMRARARSVADAGVRTPLEGEDGDLSTTGWTDASGVVLTPKEIAELQGNPLSAFGITDDTVVVVYDDGARAVWPDEFVVEPETVRPIVGDTVNGKTVAAILDGTTGETIEGDLLDQTNVPHDPPAAVAAAFLDGVSESLKPEHLPTGPDFDFVKGRNIATLRDDLEDITDADQLRRLLNAEKQGRGVGGDPRSGAVKVIEARLEYVTSGVKLKLVKE